VSASSRVVACFSSAGQVRGHNEDCAAIDGHRVRDGTLEVFPLKGPRHVLLVADGMGGHAKGEVASASALRLIGEFVGQLDEPSSCVEVLRAINRRLYDEMHADKALLGMGTTIVGLVIRGESLTWFNVGDSRAYLYRSNCLRQITIDHVPEDPANSRGRRSHAITQSLGGGLHPIEVWPAVGTMDILPGDRLMACSDGLTDVVDDKAIANILNRVQMPEASVRCLFEATLKGGAPDNITVIVAAL
jgi:serine/threonine protein phosphatase PrpC